MPIIGKGWELLVVRFGIQRSGSRKRTYSAYQAYINGQPVDGLSGNICEPNGPGDKINRSGHRILEGRYPLWTQAVNYRTIGYSTDTKVPGMTCPRDFGPPIM